MKNRVMQTILSGVLAASLIAGSAQVPVSAQTAKTVEEEKAEEEKAEEEKAEAAEAAQGILDEEPVSFGEFGASDDSANDNQSFDSAESDDGTQEFPSAEGSNLDVGSIAKQSASVSGFLGQSKMGKIQIANLYAKTIASSTPFAYEKEPSLKNPYAAGKLAQSNRTAALNYVNMYRRIAGLTTITEDADWSNRAQYGAVLLASIGKRLSHYPEKPDDMDDAFYQTASAATSSSNLSAGYARIEGGIGGQMLDNSGSNLTSLGHRRWLLYSNLNVMGFGGAKTDAAGSSGCYYDYKVFSNSYRTQEDWDFISWPSSGYFPYELAKAHLPWSISLNKTKYEKPDLDQITVIITAPNGVKETFDKRSYSSSGTIATNSKYFNVNTNSYGDPYCLIMNVGSNYEGNFDQVGDYIVSVTGLKSADTKEPVQLLYKVSMFDTSQYAGKEEVTEEQVAKIQAFVERMYDTCLGRKSDAKGLQDWTMKLVDQEITGTEMANGFVFSDEMKAKNLCNSCFTKVLYEAMMGRGYDYDGLQYWMSEYEKGAKREEVFNGFAQSNEFTKICKDYGIKRGDSMMIPQYGTIPTGNCAMCNEEDGVSLFVKRLYATCMDREPDAIGLAYWTGQLWKHELSGTECANGFVQSNEFKAHEYNNTDYLEHLYQALMGRGSDPEGLAYWLNQMQGGMSRDEVFKGFAQSIEFGNICKKYGIDR